MTEISQSTTMPAGTRAWKRTKLQMPPVVGKAGFGCPCELDALQYHYLPEIDIAILHASRPLCCCCPFSSSHCYSLHAQLRVVVTQYTL